MSARPIRFLAVMASALSGITSTTGFCSVITELWPTVDPNAVHSTTYVSQSYRANVDNDLSAYTLTPAYFPIGVVGQPLPPPPDPTVSAFTGSLDLELRTYVWFENNYGTPLAAPVTEHWLFVSEADLELADPSLSFGLPDTILRVRSDGTFRWSAGNCPTFPEAPWAPGYNRSCSILLNYSASLTGQITVAGLEIDGYWSASFADSESYRIVAEIQGSNGVPSENLPAAPIPSTAWLVLGALGVIKLRRRRSSPRKGAA